MCWSAQRVLGIYKYLGFNVGMLDHFAAFNKNCEKFKIAVPPSEIKAISNKSIYEFYEKTLLDTLLIELYESVFYKEKVHIKLKNFLLEGMLNILASYIFHEVKLNDVFQGFIVSREVKHGGGIALRIIEVVSQNQNITDIINDFATVLNNSAYEYIDVYASGLDENILTSKNYEKIVDAADIIVPEYFQPFEMKNIDINYVTTAKEKITLLKEMEIKIGPTSKSQHE